MDYQGNNLKKKKKWTLNYFLYQNKFRLDQEFKCIKMTPLKKKTP